MSYLLDWQKVRLKIYNIQSVQNEQAPILELEIDGLFKEDSKPFLRGKQNVEQYIVLYSGDLLC